MKIEVLEPGSDLAPCREIRRQVFIVEQSVPEEVEWDGQDAAARHLLIWDGARAVATLRLRRLGDTGKLERVAVDAEYRGQNLGAALVEKALELLKADPGVTRAKLGAQTYVIPFYEKYGFAAYGPVYQDGGIPHRDMVLEL